MTCYRTWFCALYFRGQLAPSSDYTWYISTHNRQCTYLEEQVYCVELTPLICLNHLRLSTLLDYYTQSIHTIGCTEVE